MSDDDGVDHAERDDIQYGDGRVDWAHVEITPLSQARVGVYLPIPLLGALVLLAYRRSTGLEVDLQ